MGDPCTHANVIGLVVYNKWHETELERWLSDHGMDVQLISLLFIVYESDTFSIDIPYPSPADRRDLENLVKSNWEARVQKPLGNAADRVTDEFHEAKEWVFDT